MIAALADAGAVLERADYLDAAVAAAEFVAARAARRGRPPAAHLQPRPGEARRATSRTTRSCSRRCSTLYEATFDPRWFARGARARRRRSSSASPTPSAAASSPPRPTTSAVARRKDLEDTPIPSGGSAAAFGLLRLAALTGERALRGGRARACCALLHTLAPQHPAAFGHLLQALDFHARAGARGRARRRRPRPRSSASCAARFRPHLVLAGGERGDVPLLEGRDAGRRPRRRLRVRALRLPAPGDRPGELRRARLTFSSHRRSRRCGGPVTRRRRDHDAGSSPTSGSPWSTVGHESCSGKRRAAAHATVAPRSGRIGRRRSRPGRRRSAPGDAGPSVGSPQWRRYDRSARADRRGIFALRRTAARAWRVGQWHGPQERASPSNVYAATCSAMRAASRRSRGDSAAAAPCCGHERLGGHGDRSSYVERT